MGGFKSFGLKEIGFVIACIEARLDCDIDFRRNIAGSQGMLYYKHVHLMHAFLCISLPSSLPLRSFELD